MSEIGTTSGDGCSRQRRRRLVRDESAATTLEWALLLAVVALPSFVTIKMLRGMLTDYYRMQNLLNSLPFP